MSDEPIRRGLLEHMVKNPSQYDGTCRQLAAQVIQAESALTAARTRAETAEAAIVETKRQAIADSVSWKLSHDEVVARAEVARKALERIAAGDYGPMRIARTALAAMGQPGHVGVFLTGKHPTCPACESVVLPDGRCVNGCATMGEPGG